MKISFDRFYLLFTLLLLATEILIALYVHDKFVRPYGGDFLIVILIYCFIKSFFNLPVLSTALSVLVFSYAVEVSQYFHLVSLLGLQNSRVAKTVLGTTFSFVDIMCYTLGVLTILLLEGIWRSLKKF